MSKKPRRRAGTKARKDVRIARRELATGRVLAVDPSSGSLRAGSSKGGSQPGWAIFDRRHFVESGVLALESAGRHVEHRLPELARLFRELWESKGPFDVLVIEDIPLYRFGGGESGIKSARSQLSLHYGVAVALSQVPAKRVVRIHPLTWRAFVPDNYEKTDESDAYCIGVAAFMLLDELENDRGLRMQARRRREKDMMRDRRKRSTKEGESDVAQ